MHNFLKNDYWWALFWLVIILFLFFLPVIIGRQTLFPYESTVFSSASGKFYQLPGLKTGWNWGGGNLIAIEAPQTIAGIRMLQSGILPFWNPFSAGGSPLMETFTSALYFPIKFILKRQNAAL